MVTVTPGITAFCESVIVPCSVAVDCADALAPTSSSATAHSTRTWGTDLVRFIIHPPELKTPRAKPTKKSDSDESATDCLRIYRGMLPCFLGGPVLSRLFSKFLSAVISFLRVSRG